MLACGASLPTVKVRWRRISACSKVGVTLTSFTGLSSTEFSPVKPRHPRAAVKQSIHRKAKEPFCEMLVPPSLLAQTAGNSKPTLSAPPKADIRVRNPVIGPLTCCRCRTIAPYRRKIAMPKVETGRKAGDIPEKEPANGAVTWPDPNHKPLKVGFKASHSNRKTPPPARLRVPMASPCSATGRRSRARLPG